MIVRPSKIDGSIPSTPSRWHTQYCLALASLAFGRSRLERCAVDDVTISLMKGLEAMGARFEVSGGTVRVDGGLFHPRGEIDAKEHHENLAILAGVAGNLPRNSRIVFEPQHHDPYPFLNALMALGVSVSSQSQGRESPWLLRGPSRNGSTHVPGTMPPAYVCSLVLATLLRMRECDIVISSPDFSRSLMGVSEDALASFGVGIASGMGRIRVSGSEPLRPASIRIMDDAELAAYPLALGALCGRVTVNGDISHQAATAALMAMGVDLISSGDAVTSSSSELRGGQMDLSSCPRTFPVMAVLAAKCLGSTVIHSAIIPDRDLITPTVTMLRRMGCAARATEDGAVIPGSSLHGADLGMFDEPLVAMAAVIAAASSEGRSRIGNPEIIDYGYPCFLREMELIGLDLEED